MTLTQKELQALLSYDAESGRFIWLVKPSNKVRIGSEAGHKRKRGGYIYIKIKEKGYFAHQLAWFYVYGYWARIIDHKDRNPSNNALSNLREATVSQNALNSVNRTNTSGYRGVTWNKRAKKWQAQARLNNRYHYLGVFESSEDASSAFEAFSRTHHGQFFCESRLVAV